MSGNETIVVKVPRRKLSGEETLQEIIEYYEDRVDELMAENTRLRTMLQEHRDMFADDPEDFPHIRHRELIEKANKRLLLGKDPVSCEEVKPDDDELTVLLEKYNISVYPGNPTGWVAQREIEGREGRAINAKVWKPSLLEAVKEMVAVIES